ncbi:MAG TPA: kelch repeat-containing protein, partial [bacterium]
MKKMTLTFILILALTMVAWAADPYANLSSMELEHLGLNLPNGEIAPPYSPGGAVDNITWVAEPNCLNTINRAACGKVGNYVYIFGGQGSGSGATHVAFNITTELWELSTAPGVGGSNWSCAAANGALYVFPRSFGNSEVQKFVPDSTGPLGTWSLVALYPINSWANAIAWDGGNYIYCAGGSASTPLPSMVDSVYRFDLTTNTFESLAPLPEPRGYVGGAFVNGKFYVLGGDNLAYQYTSTCYEYSPATNTWAVKAPMIKASAFNCFNTVTDGDLIYLVGGGGGNATSLPSTDTVQVYNPATDTWSIETSRMNNYGTNAAAYVPEGNWIFDCGGRILTVSYNVTWRGNLTAPQPPISITLLPVNPPINIPAQGGSFDWDITLHNNESTPQTFDVWTIITLPNGSTRPGWGPFMNLTMPAGATINRVR